MTNAERELIAAALEHADDHHDKVIGGSRRLADAAAAVRAERAPKPRYHFFGGGLLQPQTYTVQDYKERKAVCFTNDAHAAELVVAALNAAEAAK